MTAPYQTPQDAEDAYYDAIDEGDLSAMMTVWEESDEILCLLPMMPAQRGRAAIETAWGALLNEDVKLDIEIKHLSWIETENVAIHLIEELVKADPETPPHPVYATNIYRKGDQGWCLVMHQNSPTPPPGLQV
ncbi:MAG: nuclear transport factor 2 family protein [Candidatus Thiodiazotropha taylori]